MRQVKIGNEADRCVRWVRWMVRSFSVGACEGRTAQGSTTFYLLGGPQLDLRFGRVEGAEGERRSLG